MRATIVVLGILVSILSGTLLGGGYGLHRAYIDCQPVPNFIPPCESPQVVVVEHVIYNNTTVETPDDGGLVPPNEPEMPREKTTTTIVVIQAPTYIPNRHYKIELELSATPHVYTEFKTGIPYINLHYKATDINGVPFNDTGMLHNGYVIPGGGYGFDFCGSGWIIRYWNWTSLYVEAPAWNRTLTYASHPVPDNMYNLLGNGENCYGRVYAVGQWYVYACVEGDGTLTPYHEVGEDLDGDGHNETIYQHWDYMDHCFSRIVNTAPD